MTDGESLTDGQRLQLVINYTRLTVRAFTKSIGMDRPDTIYHVLRGRNGMSLRNVNMVVEKYPMINFVWLRTGEGEMLVSTTSNVIPVDLPKEEVEQPEEEVRNDGMKVIHVPFVQQPAAATYGLRGYVEEDPDDERTVDFLVSQWDNTRYVSFQTVGNSMNDGTDHGIRSGQLLLCKEVNPDNIALVEFFKKGPLVVFQHAGDGWCVKQLVDFDTRTGNVVCHSFNPKVKDFEVDLRHVKRMFLVKQVKPLKEEEICPDQEKVD